MSIRKMLGAVTMKNLPFCYSGVMKNPALKPFEPLIGEWETEGSHGMLPGVTLHGKAVFEWMEGGAFLMVRSEMINDSRFPNGIGIFGSDDVQKKFFMLYFDSRGVSRFHNVSIKGNVIKWWRDQPGFYQRNGMTISKNGKTIESKGEISKDGKNWQKDLELTYTKVG